MSERCIWKIIDDDYGAWESDCGEEFIFIDGSPTDNGMNFCCYCGKPLENGSRTQPATNPPSE